LPDIAHGHHEKLDGSGYPLGLSGDRIPIQVRMLTIADMYDALNAGDRPYKEAIPPERALDILQDEARSGKIDKSLCKIFIQSHAYRSP
jgi:3',5'-cyclic-nucleotide phosphodiesterase